MPQVQPTSATRRPWNSGRIIGPKPPLKPKYIWAIRQQLENAHRARHLALFNLAIDSKLRGCDLVRLRVSDIAPNGAVRRRATVIQQKTHRPVRARDVGANRRLAGAPEAHPLWVRQRKKTFPHPSLVNDDGAVYRLARRALAPGPSLGWPSLAFDRSTRPVPDRARSHVSLERNAVGSDLGGRDKEDIGRRPTGREIR